MPAVNESLLLALVRRELSEARARNVYRLVYTYEPWNEAHTRLVVQEFRRRAGPSRES